LDQVIDDFMITDNQYKQPDSDAKVAQAAIRKQNKDYIDGKRELREINMAFQARYVKDDDMDGRTGSCLL
jgi:hypothetical protein